MIAGRDARAASRQPSGPLRRLPVVADCHRAIRDPASVGAGRARWAPRGGNRALLGEAKVGFALVGFALFRKIETDPGTNSRSLDSRSTSRTRRRAAGTAAAGARRTRE